MVDPQNTQAEGKNFNDSLPAWISEHCINTSIDKKICSLCESICPSKAIELGPTPAIEPDKCTSCAACAAICPSNAITHPGFDLFSFLEQLHNTMAKGITEISLSCNHIQNPSALHIPCIKSISPMHLAICAAEGATSIHLDASCEHGSNDSSESHIREIKARIKVINDALETKIMISDSAPKHKRNEQEGNPRRTFLTAYIKQVASESLSAMNHTDTSSREMNTRKAATPLIEYFIRSLKRLKPNFSPVPTSALQGIGNIQVNDQCNGCGDCVRHCPTQALEIESRSSLQSLNFSPQCCIGCGVCEEFCPEKAILSLPTISLPYLLGSQKRPLKLLSEGMK